MSRRCGARDHDPRSGAREHAHAQLSEGAEAPRPRAAIPRDREADEAVARDALDVREGHVGRDEHCGRGGDVRGARRADADLAVVVASPREHRPICAEREHARVAAREHHDLGHAGHHRGARVHHRVGRAVAEDAVLVVAPRPHGSVRAEGERVRRAGRDLDHVRETSDRSGRLLVTIRRRRVAELTARVLTEREHRAVIEQDERVLEARGHRDGVGDADDLRRAASARRAAHRSAVGLGGVAELTIAVRSPREHSTIVAQRDHVGLPRDDRHEAAHARRHVAHRQRRGGAVAVGRALERAVAELTELVAAPREELAAEEDRALRVAARDAVAVVNIDARRRLLRVRVAGGHGDAVRARLRDQRDAERSVALERRGHGCAGAEGDLHRRDRDVIGGSAGHDDAARGDEAAIARRRDRDRRHGARPRDRDLVLARVPERVGREDVERVRSGGERVDARGDRGRGGLVRDLGSVELDPQRGRSVGGRHRRRHGERELAHDGALGRRRERDGSGHGRVGGRVRVRHRPSVDRRESVRSRERVGRGVGGRRGRVDDDTSVVTTTAGSHARSVRPVKDVRTRAEVRLMPAPTSIMRMIVKTSITETRPERCPHRPNAGWLALKAPPHPLDAGWLAVGSLPSPRAAGRLPGARPRSPRRAGWLAVGRARPQARRWLAACATPSRRARAWLARHR